MKLAFLGNSLVWGGYGGNFVAEIAKLRPDHEIINCGEGGNTILNLMNRLEKVLALQPDGIFVMIGGNDAISHSQPDTRRYYESVLKVPGGIVSPDLFARSYRDLLTRIQLAHVLAWVCLEPMEFNPSSVAALREFNALAKDAADSLNVPTLDLMERLTPARIPLYPPITQADINLIGRRAASGWADFEAEQQRGGYSYSFDGIHFTPATAHKVAEWVVEFLGL